MRYRESDELRVLLAPDEHGVGIVLDESDLHIEGGEADSGVDSGDGLGQALHFVVGEEGGTEVEVPLRHVDGVSGKWGFRSGCKIGLILYKDEIV